MFIVNTKEWFTIAIIKLFQTPPFGKKHGSSPMKRYHFMVISFLENGMVNSCSNFA
jgi:hypothetical protein